MWRPFNFAGFVEFQVISDLFIHSSTLRTHPTGVTGPAGVFLHTCAATHYLSAFQK